MTEKRDELQKQHNKALARIQRQDEQIEKQITALKIQREDLEAEQKGRRDDREKYSLQTKEYVERIDVLKAQIASADLDTQEQISKLQEAVTEKEQLNLEIDNLKKDKADLEASIWRLNREIERHLKDHEDLMELYIRAEG